MGRIILIGATKGGVGKTVSTYNLAYSLASMGKKVLAVDFDSQANLTTCFGVEDTGALSTTIGHLMMLQLDDEELPDLKEYIMSRDGVDFIPSSMVLSAVDAKLRMEMGAEKMLANILEPLRDRYDYLIVDTCPALGALTINTLAAADGVVITVNPQLLAMKGLQDFLKTIQKIKKRINPKLEVEGILLTMCDMRTNLCKVISEQVAEAFEGRIRIFESRIPSTVKVGESIYYCEPLLEYAPQTKVSRAYLDFGKELIGQEYGMTGRNIARYVRCNQLIPAFKEMLDDGSLTLVSGVELSFLSEEEQELVNKALEQNGIRVKGNIAKKLKAAAGTITEKTVRSILALDKSVTEVKKKSSINVKVPADVYHRYFSEVDDREVQKILVEALGLYFMAKGE